MNNNFSSLYILLLCLYNFEFFKYTVYYLKIRIAKRITRHLFTMYRRTEIRASHVLLVVSESWTFNMHVSSSRAFIFPSLDTFAKPRKAQNNCEPGIFFIPCIHSRSTHISRKISRLLCSCTILKRTLKRVIPRYAKTAFQ